MTQNRGQFWDYVAQAHSIEFEVELFNKPDQDFVTCLHSCKIAIFEKRLKCCVTI